MVFMHVKILNTAAVEGELVALDLVVEGRPRDAEDTGGPAHILVGLGQHVGDGLDL